MILFLAMRMILFCSIRQAVWIGAGVACLLGACSSSDTRTEQVHLEDSLQDSVVLPSRDSLVSVDGTAYKPDTTGQSLLSPFAGITAYQPGYATNELSIRAFVSQLRTPDSTLADPDTLCPVGQLHFWNLPAQNCRIFALGDAYTATPNLTARCRVYGIQSLNTEAASAYTGFLGIQLGQDETAIRKRLEDFVAQNPAYQYEKVKGTSAIEKFLNNHNRVSFVLTNKQQYYVFGLGKKKQLEYIVIANMDPRAAC